MLQLCMVELEATGTVKLQEARAAMRAERSARAHAESQASETAINQTSICGITRVMR